MEPSDKVASESVDVQDELKKYKEENSALNRRLLGVNELARLLQEKTELSNNLEEKNKRLEIAVVRLENRCSNLEKKMKSGQFSSLPSNPSGSGNPKSLPNSPFIPGPSRQILEQLMKDNHELKKTINNLTKGGPVGYKEAVKMNHLEEVIDQKNGKIDLLQKQIESLTAPTDAEGSKVTVDPGLLKRQLLKMEQAMKVKDRFCTLLSDRVTQLEQEMSSGKLEGTDGEDETESKEDWSLKEKKFTKMMAELQSQVEQERNEKKDMLSKAEESSRKVANLESEKGSLIREIESLSTYNNTLVSEKMDLSGDVMRLNDKLQQLQAELNKKEEDFNKRKSEFHDTIADLEEDKAALNNRVYETMCKLQEVQNKGPQMGSMPRIYTGQSASSVQPLYNYDTKRGQEVTVDGHGSRLRNEPQHCGTNLVTYMNRQEILAARDVGTDGTNTDTSVPSTATTPTVTPSNAGQRSLDLSTMQQMSRFRTGQTPVYTPHPSQPNPQFPMMDSTGTPWSSQQHYPPRSLSISQPPVNMHLQQHQPPPHASLPYHVPNPSLPHTQQPQPQQPYGGGGATVFGSNMPSQFSNPGNMMMHQSPGSGYMTHSSNNEYQQARYYGNNTQPPLQRRPSPPNGGNNPHYHTGGQ